MPNVIANASVSAAAMHAAHDLLGLGDCNREVIVDQLPFADVGFVLPRLWIRQRRRTQSRAAVSCRGQDEASRVVDDNAADGIGGLA